MVDEFLVISMGLATVVVARRLQTAHSISFRLTHLLSPRQRALMATFCSGPEESTYEDFGGGEEDTTEPVRNSTPDQSLLICSAYIYIRMGPPMAERSIGGVNGVVANWETPTGFRWPIASTT